MQAKQFIRKNSFIFLLIAFFAVDMAFLPFIFSQNRENGPCQATQKKIFLEKDSLKNFDIENIPKISEINGPRIDDELAMTERIEVLSFSRQKVGYANLPTEMWIFLLIAYVVLLIFNLTFRFGGSRNIRWFWELVYTIFFLLMWFYYDSQQVNFWFPLYIFKFGILIYIAYLYFFDRKE